MVHLGSFASPVYANTTHMFKEDSTETPWSNEIVKKYSKMKSGFSTIFSGQQRPGGLSEDEWHFKYAYVQNKYDIAKQDEM